MTLFHLNASPSSPGPRPGGGCRLWAWILSLLLPASLLVGQPRTVLSGSHREVLTAVPAGAGARPEPMLTRTALRPEENDALLDVEVVLRMRDFAGLQDRVHRGERISSPEMLARHAPLATDYQAVSDWLTGAGLTITQTDPGQMAVFVRGTVRQLQAAFQVTFARVAFQNAEYSSAITAPSLPSALAAAVLGVNGLQPHLRPQKHLRQAQPIPAPDSTGSTTAPPYWPRDILRAYGGSGLSQTGAGQTIGIVIDTFPSTTDLTSFWSTAGVAQSLGNIQFVQVVSGTLPAPSGEESLDVEWSSGTAPAAKVRVYATLDLSFPHLDQAYAQIYTEVSNQSQPTLHQVSLSFGLGEAYNTASQMQTDEQFFAELAAAGVTVFASSGDGGSNPTSGGATGGSTATVENPASSASVTAVGGTSLALNSSSGAVSSESVWSNSSGATGGGASSTFSRPAWQTGTGVAAGTKRLVPDVAAAADPNSGALVYLNGAGVQYGGTSWSSPTWAGFCALMNQARSDTGQTALGLLGPKIYPLLGTAAFRDITSGNNGAYSAGAGFDECTGLGVPNLAALLSALSNSPTITASPTGQTEAPGATGVLTVAAGGVAPLSYQWQRLPAGSATWVSLADDATYSGTATTTLTVSGLTTAMNGDQFRCVITNPFGSVTSSAATLTVATFPATITASPVSLTVPPGGSGTFTAGGGGTPAPTFQWQRLPAGGATWASLADNATYAGSATATLMVNGASLAMHGDQFRCVATNPNGSATSSAAGLLVIAPCLLQTVAGSPGVTGSTNGASGALFNFPNGIAVDPAGNIYVADMNNNLVRKITPAGSVSTLAGSGAAGSTDGTGTAASFNGPAGVVADAAGNVYVADYYNYTIRKITAAGVVTTLAGRAGRHGTTNGAGTIARFYYPADLAVDAAGNLYVADQGNNEVRMVTPAGAVSTFAGSVNGTAGSADGTGTGARFNQPGGIAVDAAGVVYVADQGNNLVRKITAGIVVTTLAGSAGVAGSTDALTGAGALLNSPGDVMPDGAGNVYVVDCNNYTLRKILATGGVATVAGLVGIAGSTDGVGTAGRFLGAGSIAMDPSGNFIIADTTGDTIRRAVPLVAPQVQITPTFQKQTVANNAVFAATATGSPAPTFQWQRLPAGSSTWGNLTDNANYSGSASAILTVTGVTFAMDGDLFRCVASNLAGSATSPTAALSVLVPPQIISGNTTTFTAGLPGSFTVAATGVPAPSLSATGLPAWASLDPVSGVLNGTPPDDSGSPFTLTLTASNGVGGSATQTFTLAVQSNYSSWQAGAFTSAQLANPAVSGPNAVLTADGAPNLLKYAFGIGPFDPLPLPPGGQAVAQTGSNWSFTFSRPADRIDLTYTVQVSTDLATWTRAGVSQQLLSTTGTVQTWQASVTSAAPALFFRLLVTGP